MGVCELPYGSFGVLLCSYEDLVHVSAGVPWVSGQGKVGVVAGRQEEGATTLTVYVPVTMCEGKFAVIWSVYSFWST